MRSVYEIEESLSPQSVLYALLEAFNTSHSVLKSFPSNWQTASDGK